MKKKDDGLHLRKRRIKLPIRYLNEKTIVDANLRTVLFDELNGKDQLMMIRAINRYQDMREIMRRMMRLVGEIHEEFGYTLRGFKSRRKRSRFKHLVKSAEDAAYRMAIRVETETDA